MISLHARATQIELSHWAVENISNTTIEQTPQAVKNFSVVFHKRH